MKIPCSNCNQRLEIPEELAGQTIECPACKASLAVPPLAPPPSATPQARVTTPQAAKPQKSSPRRQTSASPKAASSKKSKSPIPKWVIAAVAGVVIVVLMLVIFNGSKPKAQDISIHVAARTGNIEAVKKHLADGVDVNAKDEAGMTPLLLVGIDNDLHHVLEEIAELLIAKGADLEAKTNGGHTPLDNAAAYNHKGVAELLIANGADVNARANNRNTPLDSAISLKRTELAELLRKHGGKTKKELKAAGK